MAARELGIPYQVIRYERDAVTMFAPASLKAIHPLGKSPVIRDGDTVVAESCAIIEYLVEHHGPQLAPPPTSATATGCTTPRDTGHPASLPHARR